MPLTNERRWYQEPALVMERLRPQVEQLLTEHQVPKADADKLLQDMVLALLYKWDEIHNPDHWLLRTLEQRCQRLYGHPSAKPS